MKDIQRQGDVILVESEINISTLVSIEGEPILAYGEVTGHAHRLYGEHSFFASEAMTKADVSMFARTGAKKARLYVVARNEHVNLKHEEHAPLVLKNGKLYEIRRQREWSDAEEPIAVAD